MSAQRDPTPNSRPLTLTAPPLRKAVPGSYRGHQPQLLLVASLCLQQFPGGADAFALPAGPLLQHGASCSGVRASHAGPGGQHRRPQPAALSNPNRCGAGPRPGGERAPWRREAERHHNLLGTRPHRPSRAFFAISVSHRQGGAVGVRIPAGKTLNRIFNPGRSWHWQGAQCTFCRIGKLARVATHLLYWAQARF